MIKQYFEFPCQKRHKKIRGAPVITKEYEYGVTKQHIKLLEKE